MTQLYVLKLRSVSRSQPIQIGSLINGKEEKLQQAL